MTNKHEPKNAIYALLSTERQAEAANANVYRADRTHPAAPWKDVSAMAIIGQCVRRVNSPNLFNFLGSVLYEPEILEVFAHLQGRVAGIRHYRGECLDKCALRMLHSLQAVKAPAVDAVYCAALLLCVQDQFEYEFGLIKATDILCSVVCASLHRLDDADPVAANHLRALMGWGNEDEMDIGVVQGFKSRVLAVYEQEISIQLMRMQPIALHGNTFPTKNSVRFMQ